MESVSVANSVLDLWRALGPLAVIIILCIIAFFVIREVKKENAQTRKSIEGRLSGQDSAIKNLEKDMKYIQREYITKEEHYRDTEGWKTEIQGIRKDMGELPLKILNVIQDNCK